MEQNVRPPPPPKKSLHCVHPPLHNGSFLSSPGNPTGQQLAVADVQALVKFCVRHSLVLFADEVYQENVYTSQPFVSARKVLSDMGPPYDKVRLV